MLPSGDRAPLQRTIVAGALVLSGMSLAACGMILGIDSGKYRGDGDASLADVEIDDVATQEGGTATDGGVSVDAAPPADASAGDGSTCNPDLAWCDTHCGKGLDNCNQARDCPSNCPSGEACVGQQCTCVPDPNFCANHCLSGKDNCGNDVTCPGCEAGVTCYSGACGCMPEAVATACGAKQCGQAVNNCNQAVSCGANGACATSGDVCLDAGTCCTPTTAANCQDRCQTQVSNGCGQMVPCPVTCPNGGTCISTRCCYSNGTCSGNCLDSCGQYSAACCSGTADGGTADSGPPKDSGGPPVDAGGTCNGTGGSCASGCCPGLVCGGTYTCATSCRSSSAPCSQTSDCCYGLSCIGGVVAASVASSGGPIVPDSGATTGTCQ
jgi:hypothetical protein